MMQELVWFEQVEFLVIASIVIILAYLALEHRNIVYAALFFGFMASFVAGIFLLLEAPFIAGMQIAVYTGGISALIIFAVLLIPRAQDSSLESFASPRRRRIGLVLSGLVGFLSGGLALVFPCKTHSHQICHHWSLTWNSYHSGFGLSTLSMYRWLLSFCLHQSLGPLLF